MIVSALIPLRLCPAHFTRIQIQRCQLSREYVKTMASGKESLAAGVIFTVPALLVI